MQYFPGTDTVIYKTRIIKGLNTNFGIHNALDFLAMITSHIPQKGEHLVRYYGYYSNASRGKRAKAGLNPSEETAPSSITKKKRNQNWARLIKKVHFIDPLTCPNCGAGMKVVSWIREAPVVEKILKHVGLWEHHKTRPPPKQPKIITAHQEMEYIPCFD